MITWYEGAFLGFVQGATEFLPVSSSGHLVIGQALLGVELPGVSFEVALHFATLLSVLIVYRSRIAALTLGVARRDPGQLRYAGLLVLASVPAAIAGVGFGGFFEALFDMPAVAGAALLVTGCVIWTARSALAREPAESPGAGTALIMGLAQAAAIVPGISRSGATVVAALWRGASPSEAAAFSFLMSVPAIGGAALLKLPAAGWGQEGALAGALAVAGIVACVTGVVAIRTFRMMLERRAFHLFAPYLWVVGAAFLVFTAWA